MITKSQASQLTELLHLPEATVEDMAVVDGVGLFFVIRSTRREAECPRCGKRSRHVHTNHRYTIEDLPWNEPSVILRVNRRQFWCQKQRCIDKKRSSGIFLKYPQTGQREH